MADRSDKCGDSEHVSDSRTSSETSRSSSFSSEASNDYSKRAKRRKKRKHVEDWWDSSETCAHHPSWKTSLSKLKVIGNSQRFHPFAIRTGLPRHEQVLITNPVVGVIFLCTLSAEYTVQTICRTIESADIIQANDCLFFFLLIT